MKIEIRNIRFLHVCVCCCQDDGLLLYNGPIGEIDLLTQPEDFISLELLGGYPRLMINHGTGTQTLTLDGRDKTGAVIMRKLSDGVWHRIDIIRFGKVSCVCSL